MWPMGLLFICVSYMELLETCWSDFKAYIVIFMHSGPIHDDL